MQPSSLSTSEFVICYNQARKGHMLSLHQNCGARAFPCEYVGEDRAIQELWKGKRGGKRVIIHTSITNKLLRIHAQMLLIFIIWISKKNKIVCVCASSSWFLILLLLLLFLRLWSKLMSNCLIGRISLYTNASNVSRSSVRCWSESGRWKSEDCKEIPFIYGLYIDSTHSHTHKFKRFLTRNTNLFPYILMLFLLLHI